MELVKWLWTFVLPGVDLEKKVNLSGAREIFVVARISPT
jgi:hypothetical protein